jgi:hypothetical protein
MGERKATRAPQAKRRALERDWLENLIWPNFVPETRGIRMPLKPMHQTLSAWPTETTTLVLFYFLRKKSDLGDAHLIGPVSSSRHRRQWDGCSHATPRSSVWRDLFEH